MRKFKGGNANISSQNSASFPVACWHYSDSCHGRATVQTPIVYLGWASRTLVEQHSAG
ncbi:hypothetical protein [Polynucleobacter necessarius]|uniref:hypothetical protein n=1 Tax=Polynucleobacter necessarius TaxID=576610 RepID=UPI0018D4FA2A|nr:hypothetical protein [Polynucleobacter necessarius]